VSWGSGLRSRVEGGEARGPPAVVPLRPDLKTEETAKTCTAPASIATSPSATGANNPAKAVDGNTREVSADKADGSELRAPAASQKRRASGNRGF
jgi:hypothetical protein